MSKATLTFDMPEEQVEFDLAYHGSDYHNVLWDLDQELRNWLKHGHEFKETGEALEAVRSRIHELMEDQGVHFQP